MLNRSANCFIYKNLREKANPLASDGRIFVTYAPARATVHNRLIHLIHRTPRSSRRLSAIHFGNPRIEARFVHLDKSVK